MKEYTKSKINLAWAVAGLVVVVVLLGIIFVMLSKTLPMVIALWAVLAAGGFLLFVSIQSFVEMYQNFKFRKEVGKDV